MIGVVICTHGAAGRGLVQSAEMICGVQENVAVVSYEMGETVEMLQQHIVTEFSKMASMDSLLILTDIKGGTPFNVMVNIIRDDPRYRLLTGINTPMLLELFINRTQMAFPELAEKLIQSGKKGIYQYVVETEDIDEDF
ncbi:PTS sugar transporter subunit IIA [Latilactobacillus sakei]|uniref:PTS sugar transporter subunit IIA n=1 Tax=Latilactobacillus sakei TaxID=1599 RepID=UPI003F533F79